MTARATRVLEMPSPPPNRGPLLDAETVRRMIGGADGPSLDWIYANVPHKVKISHRCVRWFEADVKAWLEDACRTK